MMLKYRYDDGGFSGGMLERPAIKRLLEDVRQGLVNTMVVYKTDRLSRSLVDFAKLAELVELFDQYKVTFMSATPSFNTTTPMGRLTLNCWRRSKGSFFGRRQHENRLRVSIGKLVQANPIGNGQLAVGGND